MALLLTVVNVGLLYVAFAAVPAVVATFAWDNREKPGAVPLVATGIAASAATAIQGIRFLELALGTGVATAVALHIVFAVCVNVAVLGTLYIAVEYTGRTWLSRRWLVVTLAVVGVALPTARLTAGAAGAGTLADADFLYRVALSVLALAFFVRQVFESRGVYRKQSLTLLAGFGVATCFGIGERFVSLQFVELTLVGMTVGACVIAWALFRYEFLETVPIAREMLFDQVTDPVVAIDGSGRVVDINEAATTAFGLDRTSIGTTSAALFANDPALADEYDDPLARRETLGGVVSDGRRHFKGDHHAVAALRAGERPDPDGIPLGVLTEHGPRYYRVTSSLLRLAPQFQGQLVVFRDVTQEVEREQDLDILKQVLTRVLRHNLRNELSAIRGFASAIREREDGESGDLAERIVAITDRLTGTSETARRIEDVIDADGPVRLSLGEVVADAAATVRKRYPAATIETTVPDADVRVNPELSAALAETIENGVVHNTAPDPRVVVAAERDNHRVTLTVTDEGPGIPPSELDVLSQGGETALLHGSGAGLWLVRIAVDVSGGDVDFETGADGTTVRFRLPAAGDAAEDSGGTRVDDATPAAEKQY